MNRETIVFAEDIVIWRVVLPIVICALSARLETSRWEMKQLNFPSITRFPRGFHTNARLKIKYTARFRKIYRQILKNITLENKESARFYPSSKMRRTSSLILAWERLQIHFQPLRGFKFNGFTYSIFKDGIVRQSPNMMEIFLW